MAVGEKVWAWVPTCEHLHIGHILGHYKNTYLIKFKMPWLGSLKIPIGQTGPLGHTGDSSSMNNSHLKAVSRYIDILELKQKFLESFKSYNDLA